MRDPEVFSRTSKAFREAGYQVEARVLAVHERMSWQGVLQRYEAQKAARGSGRMTAPHSHRDAYEGAPKTVERIEVERLADRIVVVRRGCRAVRQPVGGRAMEATAPGARRLGGRAGAADDTG